MEPSPRRAGSCSASHGTWDQSTQRGLDAVREMNYCCEKHPGVGWHTRPQLGPLDQLGDLG